MEPTRYNLRPTRRECRIPVQLQLATDEDFVTASGSRMESVQAGQVFSERSDSESDIDLSAFGQCLDNIEKNTLSNVGTKPKVTPRVRRPKSQSGAKAYVASPQKGSKANDTLSNPRMG